MDATGRLRGKIAALNASPSVSPPVAEDHLRQPDNFLQHSVTLTLATGVVNAANWLYHVIMSRSLGPEEYGVLSAIIGILIILIVPSHAIQMGVSAFIARSDAPDQRAASTVLMRSASRGFLLLGVAASLALIFGSDRLAGILRLSSSFPLKLAAVALIPWAVLPVLRGVLQGLKLPVALGGSMAAEATLKLAAAVLFVLMGYGLAGAIGGLVVGGVAALGITVVILRSQQGKHHMDQPTPLMPLLRSLIPFALAVGCYTVLTQSDVVLVKALFPPHEAGLYAAASTGGKMVLYVTGALPMVMLPRMIREDRVAGEGRAVLTRGMLYTGLAGGVLVIAYFAMPRQLIGLLFGPAYRDAAPILGPLGIAMLSCQMAVLGTYYLLGIGRLRMLRPVLLVAVVFPLAVWLSRTSIETVAVVVAVIGLLTASIVWWCTTREVAYAAS